MRPIARTSLSSLVLVFFLVSPALSAAGRVEALVNEANRRQDGGDSRGALLLAQKALLQARQSGDRLQEARALRALGQAHLYLGNPDKAVEGARGSLAVATALGDHRAMTEAGYDLGIACKYTGRYDEAFDLLRKSVESFRALNDSGHAVMALLNLGMGYVTLGAFHLALDIYQEALAEARDGRDKKLVFAALARLGHLYMEAGNAERALHYFLQAQSLARAVGPREQVYVLGGLSIVLSQIGRVDEALATCHRAIELETKMHGEKALIAGHIRSLGNIYLEHDPAKAAYYYQKALRLWKQQHKWDPYHKLARAQRKLGELDRAVENYEAALEILEPVRAQVASRTFRATFGESVHQKIYRGLIETLMDQAQARQHIFPRIFGLAEQATARTMLEAVAEAQVEVGREIDAVQRSQQVEIGARISAIHRDLSLGDLPKGTREQKRKSLNGAELEFDVLSAQIRQTHPRFVALRYPKPVSLEQAQATLTGGQALLGYLLTENSVFGYAIARNWCRIARLPVAPKVLSARMENYLDLLDTGDGNEWRRVSERLYFEIAAPLIEHLPQGISHLLVIPDGTLHYMPFETLTRSNLPLSSRRAGPRFLIQDYAISYVPSATVLGELKSSVTTNDPGRAKILILANPATGPAAPGGQGTVSALFEDEGLAFDRIASSSAEARTIARYGWKKSTIYTGEAASEAMVKKMREPFDVIHFATHGLISRKSPLRSALVLSPGVDGIEDGFLQVREIYGLNIVCDLVVLSACQSARGQILAGEGAQGLAQAFLHAGARSVVASLWNVNDQRTFSFMSRFYFHLAEGKSKGAALRSAKLDMLSRNDTANPRYWAPFILIGESDRSIKIGTSGVPSRFVGWAWVAGAIILVGSGMIRILRRRARSPVST